MPIVILLINLLNVYFNYISFTLLTQDQHEVDQLNDDIRRLTQENKEAFTRRMKLEADKNKLENLLTNNLHRRKDELMQVCYKCIAKINKSKNKTCIKVFLNWFCSDRFHFYF